MASRFYREDDDYYYDPSAEMAVAPAAATTTVSGIGSPAASTAASTTALTPQQIADLQASAALMQGNQAGPNMFNAAGGLGSLQGGTLSEFDPLYNYAKTAPILTMEGNKANEKLRFQPLPGQMYRLIVNGKELGRGNSPEGVANLVTAANQFSKEGGSKIDVRLQQEVSAMIDGQPKAVFADTYVNSPNNNGFLDIAIPVALAVMGGVALGPLISATAAGNATALGLAAGVGLGTTAGNVLVGQPVDESLVKGLTAAATAYGGAGLGPIIGGGSFGVAAGAGGANLAANLAQGKSFEDSLKSAAIAGVTAGALNALTKGLSTGKTSNFTANELAAANATGGQAAQGVSLDSSGAVSTSAGNVPLNVVQAFVAKGIPLAGVGEAITVTARSLGISIADMFSASASAALTQAANSLTQDDVARAREAAAESVGRSRSDAQTRALNEGLPEGYEIHAKGTTLDGAVLDPNGNIVVDAAGREVDWFGLSGAQKASFITNIAGSGAVAGTAATTVAGGSPPPAGSGTTAPSSTVTANTGTTAGTTAGAAAGAVSGIGGGATTGGAEVPGQTVTEQSDQTGGTTVATGGGGDGGTTQTVNTDRDTGTTVATGGGGGGDGGTTQTVNTDRDTGTTVATGGGGGGDGGTTQTVTQPRTRTVSSILDLGTPQEVLSTRRIRELLGLPAGIGSETFEVPLELETPYDIRGERLRNQIGLPAGLGTTFVDEGLDLGPREIRVTGRRTPISVSAQPRTLSEELNVPFENIINVVQQRNILAPAPVITPETTARENISVKDQEPIDVKGERRPFNLLANTPYDPNPVRDILGDSQDKPSTKKRILSTLRKIGGLTPLLRLLAEAVDDGGGGEGGTVDRGTGYTVPQGRRTLGTFNDDPFTYGQRSGELLFFNNNRGGTTTGIGGGTTTGGATGATAGTGGGATSTAGTPGPAATAAEVQAAFPGYTNIRQAADGRWFGEPIPGYTASGTPATGLRVTAGGTFDPTVADYQALNPGFESIVRNEAGEYIGVRTEEIAAIPGMTEAQVRAQFPGYASYEKDAAGKWVGIRAVQTQTLEQVRAANPGYDKYEQDASGQWFGIRNPTTTAGRAATEADARAQNPGYDAYTKDANGQWVGIKNIAATTSGLLTEAQVRAANPGYSAYEKDASGQWVGIKNIETRTPRATTLDQVRAQYGANYDTITQNEAGKFIGTKTIPGQGTSMTLDQIRLAFPQYSRIEQLPTGDYVGITDVTEEVPFTLAQAQERFGSTYSNIRPGEQGQYIGTRTATRPVTLADVRGLGLDYSDFEQGDDGNFYGIRNVETRTPRPLTLADYQANFGPQYSEIRQNPQGQFVGVGTRQVSQAPTIDQARNLFPGYQDYEQGEGGIYGIRNEETRSPGAPFTLADYQAKFGSQYSTIRQNDQGQFVGETTETEEPNMAEGGEVSDDMVRHLVEYRKGGGHMGPGQVKGIGSGQEDKIPAWLSDGEYVWSAQDVADLGDGSTDEGVRRLDRMRKMVRQRAGRKDVKKIAKPQRGIEDMLKAVGGAV